MTPQETQKKQDRIEAIRLQKRGLCAPLSVTVRWSGSTRDC